jgi:hypothetical protein
MRRIANICSYAEDFAVILKSLVEESYSQGDFNVAFKSPKTIGGLFPFKDQIKEKKSQSLVVYKINCNFDYLGKTKRILVQSKRTSKKDICILDKIISKKNILISWINVIFFLI